MPLIYRDYITRDMVQEEREKVFVFGDNMARVGRAGQAKEMRGEVNAFGIATKRTPSEFMTGTMSDFMYLWNDINRIVDLFKQGRTIVWPTAGVGTGLSRLGSTWPQGLYLIESTVAAMEGIQK